MRALSKSIFVFLIICSSTALSWTLPEASLDGEDFSSKELKGTVAVIFYVSPSKKNLNNEASEAIKKESFSSDVFTSVGIVDLKSSWIPNALIVRAIKKKQKKYPRTVYLKDKDNYFTKKLNYESQGSDVFVFNADGKEVYRHLGKLDKKDIKELISTLKKNISVLTEN